jgi:hypothetical protein
MCFGSFRWSAGIIEALTLISAFVVFPLMVTVVLVARAADERSPVLAWSFAFACLRDRLLPLADNANAVRAARAPPRPPCDDSARTLRRASSATGSAPSFNARRISRCRPLPLEPASRHFAANTSKLSGAENFDATHGVVSVVLYTAVMDELPVSVTMNGIDRPTMSGPPIAGVSPSNRQFMVTCSWYLNVLEIVAPWNSNTTEASVPLTYRLYAVSDSNSRSILPSYFRSEFSRGWLRSWVPRKYRSAKPVAPLREMDFTFVAEPPTVRVPLTKVSSVRDAGYEADASAVAVSSAWPMNDALMVAISSIPQDSSQSGDAQTGVGERPDGAADVRPAHLAGQRHRQVPGREGVVVHGRVGTGGRLGRDDTAEHVLQQQAEALVRQLERDVTADGLLARRPPVGPEHPRAGTQRGRLDPGDVRLQRLVAELVEPRRRDRRAVGGFVDEAQLGAETAWDGHHSPSF